jgi:hypothetical protein
MPCSWGKDGWQEYCTNPYLVVYLNSDPEAPKASLT